MVILRPTIANVPPSTWPLELRVLWSEPTWVCLPDRNCIAGTQNTHLCTCSTFLKGPHTPLRLDHLSFDYAGPCGHATHNIYVGMCELCKIVYWVPSSITCTPWTRTDFESLSAAQGNTHDTPTQNSDPR